MHYEEIFRELNRKKIHYLVTGGVAVNLYGFTRMTMDLDLLIALDHENRAAFHELMKKLKFKTKKPGLARKLMLGELPPGKIQVVSYYREEFELIDVFIQGRINFEQIYKERKTFKAGTISIPTIPIDQLLEMKENSGRERDMIDIGYLKKIKGLKK